MTLRTLLAGEHTCPWWLIRTFDNPIRKLIHNPERILAGLVAPGDTVLDLGCGIGYFTLPLARLVGPNGAVIAADLQPQMLAGVGRRAEAAGLADRIRLHRAEPQHIGVEGPVDFALAFWMVHEVHTPEAFLAEVHATLRAGGRFLLVEPRVHVPARAFEKTLAFAQAAGFRPVDAPHIAVSRARLFATT